MFNVYVYIVMYIVNNDLHAIVILKIFRIRICIPGVYHEIK